MHFPKFWQLAEEGKALAWGWSDTSEDDAAKRAMERVQRVSGWLEAGGAGNPGNAADYYPAGPMREEVLQEFQDQRGGTAGVVSRNNSGCRVLNTVNMMFVDIDEPPANRKRRGLLGMLFGSKEPPDLSFDDRMLVLAGEWLRDHPGWGFRVYRTKAGMRMIATHAPVPQGDPMVMQVFSAFGADPLYINLCEKQQCYRARLTPKPRRCKMKDLATRWPWLEGNAEAEFRDWETRYLDAAKDYATCKFLGQFGAADIHPDLRELVEYHDSATRADTDMPLA